MNRSEFLDKIEDLLNAVDKLPEDAEILSLSIGSSGTQLQLHNCIKRLEPYCQLSRRTRSVDGFAGRQTALFGVSVIQLEHLSDAEDGGDEDEDWPY